MSPIKQAPRQMQLEIKEQVITKTKKLIKDGIIREEKYVDWITNIITIKKKNEKIHVRIDFLDLNKPYPKDDFPLPNAELMVNNTFNYDIFSFMDGSSGYNQIKIAPENIKHTFRTPICIYCYKVMCFGLKNVSTTYQRAMTCIFDDLIHKHVKCYVNDLVVKSKAQDEHIKDLRIVFDKIQNFNLKMNLLKCAFDVTLKKFLRFIVCYRGIEIDPSKIKVITEISPLKL